MRQRGLDSCRQQPGQRDLVVRNSGLSIAPAFGQPWGDPVAGVAVTAFIWHVWYEVTKDVVHRLADGVELEVITTAEAVAGSVPEFVHTHARAGPA